MHNRAPSRAALGLALATGLALTPSPARAQDDRVDAVTESVDEAVAESKKAEEEEEREDGFKATLTLGASGTMLHNYQWVGQDEGFTVSAGGLIGGAVDGVFGDHEWRSRLGYELQMLKTPAIESLLKSADNLDARTLYLYRVPGFSWVGPFARARVLTPIFPGYGVLGEGRYLRLFAPDGSEQQVRFQGAQKPFDLTGWFEPMTISESAGAFLEPLSQPWLVVNLKGGAGAQHLLAYGGYVVADDDATPELELKQLQMVHSAGAELEAELKGQLFDALSYTALLAFYYPLLISVETDLDLAERTHLELEGKLSYRLTRWLGIDYVLRVRRQPFILNDWQVQNQLLLTSTFSVL